eukprot:5958-Heterococcus_DN1.PRE.1
MLEHRFAATTTADAADDRHHGQQVNYVQCLNWVKPLQFYKNMNPDEAAEVQLIEERLRQLQYTGASVTAMDLYCIVGGTRIRTLAYAYGGHGSDAMVRRRFDKYEQPNGLVKAYKHFVGHTSTNSSNSSTNKRAIGEHELAAGLHKLGFQLSQHQVRVLLKRMSLDSSSSTASAISVSAAEFSVFVRDPYHEDVAKKVIHGVRRDDSGSTLEIVRRALNKADTSGAGISLQALNKILERAGVQLSQQDLQRLASRFDVHDDGFISTQLFTHFLDGSTATTSATGDATDNHNSSKASRNQPQHSSSRKHNSSEHHDSEDDASAGILKKFKVEVGECGGTPVLLKKLVKYDKREQGTHNTSILQQCSLTPLLLVCVHGKHYIDNNHSVLEHMGVQLSRSDIRALMAMYTSTSSDYDDVIRYEELIAALKKSQNSHNQLRTSRVRFESQLRNSHNAGSDSDSNSSNSSSGNTSSNAENRKHSSSRSRSNNNASVVKEGLKREVTRLGGSSSSGRPLKLSRTFQGYDTACDGTVSVRELQQGLEVIGIELSKAELKCVVQQFEVDNGRVSYEKLVQYITETIISASPTRGSSPDRSSRHYSPDRGSPKSEYDTVVRCCLYSSSSLASAGFTYSSTLLHSKAHRLQTVPCIVTTAVVFRYKQDDSSAVQQLAVLMHKAKAHTDDVRAELEVSVQLLEHGVHELEVVASALKYSYAAVTQCLSATSADTGSTMCDERSSGEVQVDEVKAALKSLGVHLSSALAAQLEQRYPARKRGKIRYAELCKAIDKALQQLKHAKASSSRHDTSVVDRYGDQHSPSTRNSSSKRHYHSSRASPTNSSSRKHAQSAAVALSDS